MIWAAAGVLVLCAMVLILKRQDVAEVQAMAFGARTRPGCIVWEAALLIAFAIALILLNR